MFSLTGIILGHFPCAVGTLSDIPGCVCRKVKEMGSFSTTNEINAKLSFKMDMKFETSVYMGENFLDIILYKPHG